MKLQVEHAKEHIGKKFPFTFTESAEELGDVIAYPWSHHNITISGTYWYDGNNFIVDGTVNTIGDYECTRCLTPVMHKAAILFKDIYGIVGQRRTDEDEILLCDGETIDLTELIRETLVINEPSQVLCREDCKGLCTHCGADLNIAPCSCESFEVDPRLAVLRTLLDKKDD